MSLTMNSARANRTENNVHKIIEVQRGVNKAEHALGDTKAMRHLLKTSRRQHCTRLLS